MATKRQKQTADQRKDIKWPFGPKNYVMFAIALAVIVIGYIALGYGSITLAPILLVVGYCVLIPTAIIIRGRPLEDESANSGTSVEIKSE